MADKNKSGLGGFAKGLAMRPRILMTMDNDNDMDDEESFTPDMEAAGDFIGRLLVSAPYIHMMHLQTDSFAKHLALGALYLSLPTSVDTIAEEFQGTYGVIPSYNTYVSFNQNPTVFVQDLLAYVKQNRSCMGPCSSIQSSTDIIVTELKACLYKLKNLK